MKNADYSEIGFRIMQLRNQQNISRERLADMANCDLLEYLSQRAVISEVFCDGVG